MDRTANLGKGTKMYFSVSGKILLLENCITYLKKEPPLGKKVEDVVYCLNLRLKYKVHDCNKHHCFI